MPAVDRPPAVDPAWCSDAPYLGFDGRDHRHRMGLRPLELADWLEPDDRAEAQLALKAELLARRRGEVLLDAGTPAARQAAGVLVAAIDAAQGSGGPTVDSAASTEEVLTRAALATQEDWCLMLREDTWRLRAACVCFPSRWVLREKAGATIAEIHGPVPRYDDELGGLVERFLDRLAPAKPVWRLNWNLWEDARLHQPTEDPAGEAWPLPEAEEVADRVVLRVERQTLRRLDADAVAFGIRVHQRPLRCLVDQPGALDLLRATIDGLAASPSGAKKLGRLRGPLDAWLGAAG
ncbi:MAG: DUF3445 domain-containing protein [Acidimicrobiales bacterium]|nr:DUF3445 domain-containing protein [Acidimicrobiales bacterium]